MDFGELVSSDLAYVVAAAFTGLFTLLGIIVQIVFKTRIAVNEAKDTAASVEENTKSVANGFAGRVDRKLSYIVDSSLRLEERMSQLERSMTKHLEWHMEKEKQ